jgi:hypothetical protein
MYEIKEYNDNLDLTYFYNKCKEKGFINNSSSSKLIKNLNKEKQFKLWILYNSNKPIGSTALHSFDDIMGVNSYRICARTCIITEDTHLHNIRTLSKTILQHQNITSQIFIPVCLDYIKNKGTVYITTSDKDIASMRSVHNIYAPALSKKGILKNIKDVLYKGTKQTIWQLFPDVFFEELNKYPIWDYKYIKQV